jgi:pimeloyl-ACP methyl ester carboxylesterase
MPISPYRLGATTTIALQYDQRFSYCLYVPRAFDPGGARSGPGLPVVALVHGSDRRPQLLRDEFAAFCEEHGCIALAPLFPAGIEAPDEFDGYKYLGSSAYTHPPHMPLRYDRLLLAMLDEVRAVYGARTGRFGLFGFSGGAHFAHRFLLLHPDRLLAASIAAPGAVTLLDGGRDWPAGIRGMDRLFGSGPDLPEVARVPVQLVVGSMDTDTSAIAVSPDHPAWVEGVNDQGVSRVRRLEALRDSLASAGVRARYEVVTGGRHDLADVLPPARRFLSGFVETRGQDG